MQEVGSSSRHRTAPPPSRQEEASLLPKKCGGGGQQEGDEGSKLQGCPNLKELVLQGWYKGLSLLMLAFVEWLLVYDLL
jgi:hypothetical protein